MNRICEECGRVMSYDPYFKKYVCPQCGCQARVEDSQSSNNQTTKSSTSDSKEKVTGFATPA